ncbi:unnamed protein product [Closterium sp. NIES-54]
MDLERPTSDVLLRLRAVLTTSTSNPDDTGPATMEEEAYSSKSAPAAPDNEERTTTPATGTGWGDPGPAVGLWGEILTPEKAATIGGGWGDIGATGGAGWGQPTPAYLKAPGLPPTDVAAIDPYWATRGTSWGEPPLPDQYAPDTPEHVQELEEVTYEFFSKGAELPEPTEEAPPPEQGPQLISVTGGECLYHRVPMEGLPTSEWPKAASFPQPLITDDVVHSGNTDDIAKFPKEGPLRQIDVGSAFLYAPVDAIIFVEQLHAFEERNGALGFKQLPHDLGMYRKESRDKFILLVAYVDDLLYTGDDTELMDQFEAEIKEKLEVTFNHNATQFLGLNITQSATSIHLSTAKYVETLAKKFVVSPINLTTPYHTPPPNHEPNTTPLSIDNHRLYQQQLGRLLFAAVTCRPDLSYVASQLAHYLKRPEGENLQDLRRALQYFVSTPDVGLTYEANLTATLKLHGYIDTDHAGDIDNRHSRT